MSDHADLQSLSDPLDWLSGSEIGRIIKGMDAAGIDRGMATKSTHSGHHLLRLAPSHCPLVRARTDDVLQ